MATNNIELKISAEMAELGYTQELFESAVVSVGDTAKLAKLMERAANGEKLNYVTLGGSITAGSDTTEHKYCYSHRVYEWWCENFPKAEITYSDMGIGATGSVLGVHRLENDVLAKKPDFLIVEFAVNDDDKSYPYYECIIRRAILANPNTAIIMLFMQTEPGWNVQDTQIPIGNHYGIPMLSYRNATAPRIESGALLWKDISPDDVHPNNTGHAMVASVIKSYLDCVKAKYPELPKEFSAEIPEALYGGHYMNATLYMGGSLEPIEYGAWEVDDSFDFYHLHGAWRLMNGGEPMTFKLKFRELGIAYHKRLKDVTAGKITVIVDGVEAKSVESYAPDTWGDYMAFETVFSADEAQEHTVAFLCEEGSFTLDGIMLS